MNPRVEKVNPLPDYELQLVFSNKEVRIFDVKPYLNTGVFKELKNPELFKTVRPYLGSIAWANGQDLCPDTLYMGSTPLQSSKNRRKLKSKHKRTTSG